jgi:hypothetical protein
MLVSSDIVAECDGDQGRAHGTHRASAPGKSADLADSVIAGGHREAHIIPSHGMRSFLPVGVTPQFSESPVPDDQNAVSTLGIAESLIQVHRAAHGFSDAPAGQGADLRMVAYVLPSVVLSSAGVGLLYLFTPPGGVTATR